MAVGLCCVHGGEAAVHPPAPELGYKDDAVPEGVTMLQCHGVHSLI